MQSFSFTLRLSLDSPNQSVACKLLASCGKVNSMNALTKGRRGSQDFFNKLQMLESLKKNRFR